MSYDFSGYATRNNIKCTDGRTIMRDAFAECDGKNVPLIWNHDHSSPDSVLGHAVLENRADGVYAYGTFNETESGQAAKQLVKNGDVKALSIFANQLKHDRSRNVVHGNIRELSLVLAGANSGAYIDNVLVHSDGSETLVDEGYICFPAEEGSILAHAEETTKEEKPVAEETKEKTVGDVLATLNPEQQKVVQFVVGQALAKGNDDDEEGEEMKHNVFDENEYGYEDSYLSHADEGEILALAKERSVGSLQEAMRLYAEEHLAHGIDDIESLFPDWHNTNGDGAPELIERDKGWVGKVMSGTKKSPYSRIRTRFADIRDKDLRALGYVKGAKKKNGPNIKLLKRTTDPQTVYRKDALERDDIIDITDFDVVAFQHQIMRRDLEEEVATAIMIGDGRDEGDPDKISEEHIRSILNDDEMYSMHRTVDFENAKKTLQGTDTSKHFGDDNYVFAEAIITECLYAREKYKGTGSPTLFCTPHTVNRMLLARDMNGRRIYDGIGDLTQALNVASIQTVEQFEGKERIGKDNLSHKLIGIMVNLSDYTVGSTKGGEITSFDQFDIDFNQQKYLIETRLCGALTRPWSAIVLEEPGVAVTEEDDPSGTV